MVTIVPATLPVHGNLTVPGDKSITHRAIFFGGMNRGTTRMLSPSPAADCRASLQIPGLLGCRVREDAVGITICRSSSAHPAEELVLDCGNSGTTARLAAGFLTGEEGVFTLTGDASLSQRPMNRVADPLTLLGASIMTDNGHLPLTIHADRRLRGTDRIIDTSSAQVHGALVLAALRSEHGAVLRRTQGMRDHTLRMAAAFGAGIISDREGEAWVDTITPTAFDCDIDILVPGDFSSAAFFITAALLVPDSALTLHNVGVNPTRIAFLNALRAMGADIDLSASEPGIEPVGRIQVRYSPDLRAVDFSRSQSRYSIAEMMDELPLIALAASRAHGTTVVSGAEELRLKESDRIAAIVEVLGALGIHVEQSYDGFAIEGPQQVTGSCTIDPHGDHRICMMAAVASLIADAPVAILDPSITAVSYPDFWSDLERVAGSVVVVEGGEV